MAVAGTITRFPASRKHYSREVWLAPSSSGGRAEHYGLHMWPGGHCGPGPPSALSCSGLKRAPASSRAPATRSNSLFTVELLFLEWIGRFNRGKLGFKSVDAARNRNPSGFVKSEK